MTPTGSMPQIDMQNSHALARQFIADVVAAMECDGIDRKELGRRWGKSRQHVHMVLNYPQNFNLVSLVGLARALGRRVSVRLELKKIPDKE